MFLYTRVTDDMTPISFHRDGPLQHMTLHELSVTPLNLLSYRCMFDIMYVLAETDLGIHAARQHMSEQSVATVRHLGHG